MGKILQISEAGLSGNESVMNRKRFLVACLLTLVVFFGSCRKESGDTTGDCSPAAISSLRIREIIHYEGTDTLFAFSEKFTYNTQGRRITKVMVFTGYTDTTEVLSYEPGKVILNGDDYTMNDRGLVVNKGNSIFWTYDENGYLQKRISQSGGARDTIRKEYRCYDPVLTRGSGVDPDGFYHYEVTCEYISGSLNTIGDNNMGVAFFGRQSNSLLKKFVEPDLYSQEFTYYLDNHGRVSWMRINTSYGTIMFQEFLYQD